MMRVVRVIVSLAVLTCATAQPAWAAKWTKLRSANFLFIGDAAERDIRQLARKLEQFRSVMGVVLPTAVSSSPTPTVVIVFSSDRMFTPFKPQYQGKPMANVAGYLRPGDDVNYIAMNAEVEELALRIIFHEYSHLLIGNSVGALPVWINEGLAEFYDMYQERDGGKAALIGLSPAEHVQLLRERELMPMGELMGVDRTSPAYNESRRQGLFYAQSWALVHYLTLGNLGRAPQLRQYVQRVQSGDPSDEAFREAFQMEPAALEQELKAYVRQFTFRVQRLEFSDTLDPGALARGETIEEPEAQAYLGDLLARVEPEIGRAYLRGLVEKYPKNARATLALGLLALREEHHDEALASVERASTMIPDDGAIQGALGRVLVERLDTQRNDREAFEGTLQKAHVALTRAVDIDASVAQHVALLGYVERSRATDMPKAISLLERAARMAPAREDYRLMLGEALLFQREYERAAVYLGPLLARGSRPEIRANARTLLGRVAEERARTANDPGPRTAAASPPQPTAPPIGAGAVPPSASASAARSAAPLIPALRPVRAGETRVLGTFQSIECRQGLIVLHVAGERGPLRIVAKAFAEIDFISYLSNAPGSVTCGAIAGTPRVLATYRPLEANAAIGDVEGYAVAVELIPADFVPR